MRKPVCQVQFLTKLGHRNPGTKDMICGIFIWKQENLKIWGTDAPNMQKDSFIFLYCFSILYVINFWNLIIIISFHLFPLGLSFLFHCLKVKSYNTNLRCYSFKNIDLCSYRFPSMYCFRGTPWNFSMLCIFIHLQ